MADGRTIVIIGGGASAVYVAVALEEQAERARRQTGADAAPAPRITIVSAEPAVGRGLAYGRADAHHRLNSPAGKMSVTAGDESHFLRWCAEHGHEIAAGDYVPRRLFGDYLEDVFACLVERSGGRVRVVQGEAVDVTTDASGAGVALADGTALDADAVVLAIGNPPPVTWPTGAPLQLDDPWAPGALDAIPVGARVLMIGTGLTMVDVATSLARRDDGISLTATSRHLLLPRVHLPEPAAPGPGLGGAPRPLGRLAAELRAQLREAEAAGVPWQAVIDGMRPDLMRHWTGMSLADRRRFVAHFARRWDVHRHRMAGSVHDELSGLVDAGRLRFVARADPADYDVVVFCTGPGAVTTRGWSRLVDHLLDKGRIAPEPLGLGLDADENGEARAADGTSDGRLFAIGHALRGALWETTAIGEIRILAGRIAAALTPSS
ncbi:FAD/NAD(P)-binding protein [Gryllotalpicola ginsengisoli]|uniref:FAD/NAD(P)-binding protein n=1 Tax=Gryllotalpicola ginsengisoli TaxID=444608 RepID=UPI0003B5BEFE|nr:FAD/NAD(P)-binding protein [Gryllotalpicola ginsengisoli]